MRKEEFMKTTTTSGEKRTVPYINVTPLIDVLLVLLIIFMAVTPAKPSRFEAKLPSEPDATAMIEPNPKTLVVTINQDRSLKLNAMENLGSVDDTGKLSATLATVFEARKANHVYRDGIESNNNLSEDRRLERTVFIKAPRSIAYGEVVRVIDGIKVAGANPVGLQLDNLN
jgi:biopolymer transport protein ExbD